MATTKKVRSIAFTQEDLRLLKELCERLGENESQVIKRAISFYHVEIMRAGLMLGQNQA